MTPQELSMQLLQGQGRMRPPGQPPWHGGMSEIAGSQAPPQLAYRPMQIPSRSGFNPQPALEPGIQALPQRGTPANNWAQDWRGVRAPAGMSGQADEGF